MSCYPEAACPVAGLSAQPPCYWNVSRLAGSGAAGWADGALALAQLNRPVAAALDPLGNLAIADSTNHRVRLVAAGAASLATLAGNGTPSFANGVGTLAAFSTPTGIRWSAFHGAFVVADQTNNRIRALTLGGDSTLLAGSGVPGAANGVGSAASFSAPQFIDVDTTGNIFTTDYAAHRIRQISPANVVTTIAGTGAQGLVNGASTSAQFRFPQSVALIALGDLVVCDRVNNVIRLLAAAASWTVSTYAGSGVAGSADGTALLSSFNQPRSVTYDARLDCVYVSDSNRLRKITAARVVSTLVGTGAASSCTGFLCSLNDPHGAAVTQQGAILVAEYSGHRVQQLTCVACPASYYCASGAPVLCPPGSFCPFASVAATPCPAGTFSAATGAASSATCTPCLAGFSSAAGSSSAAACLCARGRFCLGNSSYPCPAGYYGATLGLTSPTCTAACTSVAGFGCPAGSNSSAAATQLCEPGSFCPGGTPGAAIRCTTPGNCAASGLTAEPLCVWQLGTVAGNASVLPAAVNGQGTAAVFASPAALARQAGGTLYVADAGFHNIRAVSPSGLVTTLAGSGVPGSADGAGAGASFSAPQGVAADPTSGLIYCADTGNNVIRRITSAGVVSTFAGSGVPGWADGAGTLAKFKSPCDVAVDAVSGVVYVADAQNYAVRRILANGIVSTLAGDNNAQGGGGVVTNGVGTAAQFGSPTGLVVDASGNVLLTDFHSPGGYIRRVTPLGETTTVAGCAANAFADGTGGGACFNNPARLAMAPSGYLLVADANNNRIRQVTPGGVVTTLVGTSSFGPLDGYALAQPPAQLYDPSGLAVDPATGAIVVSEAGNRLLRRLACVLCPAGFECSRGFPQTCPAGYYCPGNAVFATPCPAGRFSTSLGASNATTCLPACPAGKFSPYTGVTSFSQFCLNCAAGYYGTGPGNASASCTGACDNAGPGWGCAAGATSPAPSLCAPGQYCPGNGAAIPCTTPANCADSGMSAEPHCVWNVSSLAGSGSAGFANGVGALAAFNTPYSVAVDPAGTLYVSDFFNNRIRAVYPGGATTSLAGNGASAFGAGSGTGAKFNKPFGLALNGSSSLLVADTNNQRIRVMALPAAQGGVGTVSSFVFGKGPPAGWADGDATSAQFNNPYGVALSAVGIIYVADTSNHRIRAISPQGDISTLAGTGIAGSSDGVGTVSVSFYNPFGLVVDSVGSIVVAEIGTGTIGTGRMRIVSPTGVVKTLAGRGGAAVPWLDGVGTIAIFFSPVQVTVAASGALLVSDCNNNRLRAVTPLGNVTTLLGGAVQGSLDAFGTSSRLNRPYGVAIDANGTVYVGDSANHKIRRLTCVPCPATFYCPGGVPLLCPPGAYCPASSLPTLPTPCPAGTYNAAPGAVALSACAPCPAGSWCPLGAYTPYPCAAGRYGAAPGQTAAACSGACSAALGAGYGCAAGSQADAPALCAPGYFCPGDGSAQPCSTAANCAASGLSAEPSCLWNVTLLAGSGSAGAANGAGTAASFARPTGLSAAASGLLYIADAAGNRVRALSLAGVVATVAGSVLGLSGYVDSAGTSARFAAPTAVAVDDASGAIFCADSGNHRLRRLTPGGNVTTFAGNGLAALVDEQGTRASFNYPTALAIDAAGLLFVADCNNSAVRRVTPGGDVLTLAGTGATGGAAAGGGLYSGSAFKSGCTGNFPISKLF